ncbi:MAG TPA: dihydrofolate reductase [Acidimicrobiia bacterium]|nr:dihydrofolate reductase [Acidimicrobiia bacterium]
MPVTIVAAVARNGVIGRDNDLPWRIPEDLRRFKQLTMGGVLVMGRRTYESIGRPLPGRRTIVVSRDPGLRIDGVEVAASLEEALALAGDGGVYVVGGGEVYRQAMDLADVLEITEVDAEPEGDTYFPEIDPAVWRQVARRPGAGFTFVRYERL